MIHPNWFLLMVLMRKGPLIRVRSNIHLFTLFNTNPFWAWFTNITSMSLTYQTEQSRLYLVSTMRIQVCHKEDGEPKIVIHMERDKNFQLPVRQINLIIYKIIKVDWDNQDHLLNRVLNVFLVWLVKYSNLMTLKNPLMFKDHGFILKIHLSKPQRKERLIRDLPMIMSLVFHLEMVLDQSMYSVTSLEHTDTWELRLRLSKISRLQENEF